MAQAAETRSGPEIFDQECSSADDCAGRMMQEEDQFRFLTRLRKRLDSLNIDLPKIEIRFDKLNVEANARKQKRALPTLWNATINFMEEIMRSYVRVFRDKQVVVNILDDLSGHIRPARMVLVLGRPGSGKSTLLRALAGKLEPGLRVSGTVRYNGSDVDSVPKQASAYVGQHDLHQGELTVQETLHFSHQLFGSSVLSEILSEIKRAEEAVGTKHDPEIDALIQASRTNTGRNLTVDYMIEVLGLSVCAHTVVGDQMRRGISGGQKKRVSIGEMLVGPARAFFMDEISNGLDSSTMFKGKILYQGPRQKALDFFELMGFKCPDKMNVPDFLLEVTSGKDQSRYWGKRNGCYRYVSNQEFVESFKSYQMGQNLYGDLKKGRASSESQPAALPSKSFQVKNWDLFKASLSRELLFVKRNSIAHAFKAVQIVLLAIIVTSTFSRGKDPPPIDKELIRILGAIYAGVVVLMFNGMVELTMLLLRLPVFYKQRDLQSYPAWTFLVPAILLHLPITLFESALWLLVTYFPIGFARSAYRLSRLFLAFFCIQESSIALNRLIAALARTQVVANILGITVLVTIYVLGGFVLSKDDIKPWWIWGYWASPATYAQNSVAINEFLDKRWSTPTWGGDTIGTTFLKARGMFYHQYSFWICIGALCGFAVLFNALCIIALMHLRAPQKAHGNVASAPADDSKVHARRDSSPTIGLPIGTPERRMVLPLQPLTLTFKHINYFVDTPPEMKKYGVKEKRLQLLKDVSGAFRPGSLTALMGVTGAGKTTLMDVLAGRKTGGYIEGSIKISGYPKKQETFARVFGYCEQNDIHSPYVTIHESLLFSAWLRLSPEITSETRTRFVEEVMDLVELKGMKGSLVGVPDLFGLTTDQRKRLTIAVELVSNPSVIFMDEPTTGLDTPAATIVMRAMRNTVDTGRTVVCTIHQPNTEIFESFDELLLMKRGGQIIYSGPLGNSAQNMVNYLQAIPGVPKMRSGSNPSAWMLDVTSTDMEFDLGIDFAEYYQRSPLYKENMQLVEELSKPLPGSQELVFRSRYAQSFKVQCIACYLKQHWSYWRNPEQNLIRFVATFIVALLFGTIFWNIGYKLKREQDLFNTLGALYVSALFLGFVNCSTIQPIVWLERTVFYREKSAGMYSALPYAISQVAVEIPYVILQVILFTFIVYSMIGFQWTVVKFVWFISFVFLGFMYFTLLGMMLVSFLPSLEMAAALSFFFFILWNLFSGFFLPKPLMRVWTRWYYWMNPAAWTIYGMMVTQLKDRPEVLNIFGHEPETPKEFMETYLGLRSDFLFPILGLHVGIVFLFLFIFAFNIKHLNFQRR
ncbi:unnamed protein product [Victoria cruziana]